MKKKVPNGKSRFSAAKKNMDTMLLLASHVEFQKEVKEARIYLKIPPGGLLGNEQAEIWTKKWCERSDEMIDSPEFKRKLETIRNNYHERKLDQKMAEKQSHMIHFDIPVNYLSYTCQFLTEKYHIPENFIDDIRSYILFNKVSAPLNNFSAGWWPEGKRPRDVKFLPIRIYSQLTDDELHDLKKEIKLMGRHLPKFNPLKNIEKKLTIEKWYNDRQKFDEANQLPYKIGAAEVSENVLGTKKSKNKVYEAVRELKDLRSKRFGN